MNTLVCTRFVFAVLFCSLSAGISAQDAALPSFDSFSYLRDPLSGGPSPVPPREAVSAELPVVEPLTKGKVIEPTPAEPISCPEPVDSGPKALSADERFTIQLALDKALSQILKLTVDYETLRTRLEQIVETDQQPSEGWFSLGDSAATGEDDLQALLDLNAKRIVDRDQQIKTLNRRLEALQARFDNENVARLLAEKSLRVNNEKNQAEAEAKSEAVSIEKLQQLNQQLEANEVTIRQLKTDLNKEQLKAASEVTQSESQAAEAECVVTTESGSETETETREARADEHFRLVQEWIIEGLVFTQGATEIEQNSISSLEALLQHLKQNEALSVQINGYTDDVGTAASNLSLSQARADAVVDYLTQQGIGAHRIKALGYGERRPVASNETERGREQNRRVAVLIFE